ncbi:MAG TPA: hypothetical protein PLO62_00165 [Candidatus Hydrogenedentes bacterium]|nr:hypothetical protein [Candidatus Hydrogenedentota bacterium]HOS01862.1 hypothetical protein [Candidatus Hydrogenedentota bacterium]
MKSRKVSFALFFGNRGFFPASLMKEAREELPRVLAKWGYDHLIMPEDATRYGAVETTDEGRVYARFLQENRGRYDGVILCLPNFGDETGAVAALKEAGTPILVQAYPDALDKLGPALRRDAFCGKFSIMDVFCQYNVPFTALKPHVVTPDSDAFKANVDAFAKICRVVNGMKNMTVGMIGARTSPFKTVRCDELTLQKQGISVETFDLSGIIAETKAIDPASEACATKLKALHSAAQWDGVPAAAAENIAKLAVVIDKTIAAHRLDAIALRCWLELEEQLSISPCILMGLLNDAGIPAACETDIGSAVTMRALGLASEAAAGCLDWNNNYGSEEDKCILFHCSAMPPSMIVGKGKIEDHAILATALGPNRSFGPNTGRIAPTDFTFGNMLTAEGKVKFYLGEGAFTDDVIDSAFFGCAGVARIKNIEDVYMHIGRTGHRHHVSVTPGLHAAAIREAFTRYLGFDVTLPQES